MKKFINATAAIIATTLSIPTSHAAEAVKDYVNEGQLGRYTIVQQKKVFDFSRNNASQTMNLISEWDKLSTFQREAKVTKYVNDLLGAIDTFQKKENNMSNKSMLLADTLNNARNILVQEKSSEKDIIDKNTAEVRQSIIGKVYSQKKEVLVPFILSKLGWGQHGAHYSPCGWGE